MRPALTGPRNPIKLGVLHSGPDLRFPANESVNGAWENGLGESAQAVLRGLRGVIIF